MDYLAYHFTVEPAQPGSEILIALLGDLPFESFEQGEKGFTAYIKTADAEGLDLSGFKFGDFKYSYTVESIKQENWNEAWEKNFEPVTVDGLLCIRAPFHAKNTKVRQEIIVMPKMSFGTGHHQTTRLVCREMFGLDLEGKRVLDMGCGTGILAILAEKLGARDILGIDIDEWSVENSAENCQGNGCTRIRIKIGDVGDLKGEQPYDVILANINKNVLKKHLPVYAEKLQPGGTLLMSGFFTTDVEELKELGAGPGLQFVKTENENEWAMVRMTKS